MALRRVSSVEMMDLGQIMLTRRDKSGDFGRVAGGSTGGALAETSGGTDLVGMYDR